MGSRSSTPTLESLPIASLRRLPSSGRLQCASLLLPWSQIYLLCPLWSLLSAPFLVLQLYRLQRIRHASACFIPGRTGTGVDNIFVQPLDGSPGRQVTDLTSENISQCQWSPDGKTLAVARVLDTSDVVMLSEK
jgi:hypothetical protein